MPFLRLKLGLDDDSVKHRGLIALTLWRLKMTVDECMDAYVLGQRNYFGALRKLSDGAGYPASAMEN
ncbi:hypothetical protein BS47DRAFT_1345473 [Hydnum rufescens UP504]|uniref:Uncharacterized protein n=1 Tax=Hydnum rufescens UP504 TaxID=1448309 RepID=A0A9P6AUQ7_9AGAM|nr:hypothetical protein BS47DRAFT_1345473 [Hydnum rufescens UP504]